MESKHGLMTQCVHAGGMVDPAVGGVTTPIHASSSYRFSDGPDGVCYPRYYNIPTQVAAARKLAALEGADDALVLASGMAAVTTTLLAFLKTGDHAVVQSDVYGGTFSFASHHLDRFGVEVTLVPGVGLADFTQAMTTKTKLVYIETPTNPLLKIVDIQAVARMAKDRGALVVIDNTFASPVNQRPLALGVDVVCHSGTKYLGGHSDLCCGVVAANAGLMAQVRETAIRLGAVLGPRECGLLERSLKTLVLRVRQQNRNAQTLAEFLAGHARVDKVHYPGLAGSPGHDVARKQMDGFGGMLSYELKGDQGAARKVVDRLTLFEHAVSLGGVESLVCFPCLTSHASLPPAERARLGITDTLVRVSVGIEDPEDLVADLAQALEGA